MTGTVNAEFWSEEIEIQLSGQIAAISLLAPDLPKPVGSQLGLMTEKAQNVAYPHCDLLANPPSCSHYHEKQEPKTTQQPHDSCWMRNAHFLEVRIAFKPETESLLQRRIAVNRKNTFRGGHHLESFDSASK